ncbi:hypothetical protein [Zymobacter sp. IVIA_12111.31 C1]|uniref:hypothetical protein n=1 Tax=Zymobacter sp. IVIA_12111.31 C1 TaxID=3394854 RepID=UPI0039C336BF
MAANKALYQAMVCVDNSGGITVTIPRVAMSAVAFSITEALWCVDPMRHERYR